MLCNLGCSSSRACRRRRARRRRDRSPSVTLGPTHRKHRDTANRQHGSASDGQHNRAADWVHAAFGAARIESDQSQWQHRATACGQSE